MKQPIGIVLFASTGEGLSLSLEEKRVILHFVLKLGLNSSIMVGVPSHNLKEASNWLDVCRDFPVSAYIMTTPIYNKPGILGQTSWFEALLNKVDKPAMIYNIPSRAGIKLHSETVMNLAQHERFWAIKNSGDLESLIEYQDAAPHIKIFCGDDYMMPAMAALKAVGLVSVAANAWPESTKRYAEKCLKGLKLSSNIWWEAGNSLFTASNPIPIKALMKDVGLIAHDSVRLPLSIEDLPSRKTLLALHETMLDWWE